MSKQMVPEVRYDGFEDEWKESELNDVVSRITRRNESLTSRNPLTISAQEGLISQLKYYDWQVASKNLENYYLLYNGDFAYNKSYSNGYPVGAVKRLENYGKGVLSTLYIVFRPEEIGSNFLKHYYESTYWYKSIYEIADEGARNHGLLNVKPVEFFNTKIKYPIDKKEQAKIGKQFEQIEKIIIDKMKNLEKLINFKQAMLQKMVPKEGKKEPEVRFEGFSGEWESYELKDVSDLKHGYSFKSSSYKKNGKYPIITIKNVTGGRSVSTNNADYIDILPDNINEHQKLKKGDILISLTGNVGKASIVNANNNLLNQRVGLLDITRGDAEFMYQIVSGENFEKVMIKSGQGAAQLNISKSDVEEYAVLLPSMAEQSAIGNFFKELDNKIELEQQNLEKMKQFKKAMLQKMFV